MPSLQTTTTALLTLDLQKGVLDLVAASAPDSFMKSVTAAVSHARASKLPIIHIGLAFHPGHPEIPSHLGPNNAFGKAKGSDRFLKGTPDTEWPTEIRLEDELTIIKHRVSAFKTNNLDTVLRSMGVRTVVLCGVSTSGVVLSTVLEAYDLDYDIVVLEDACFDPDEVSAVWRPLH